jgi:hypothetical protein
LYKQIKDIVDPHIAELADKASSFQTNHDSLLKLFLPTSPINELVTLSYEDRLETESDEDYNNRNT